MQGKGSVRGRSKAALIVAIALLVGAWQQPQTGPVPANGLPTAAEINSILQELSAITGFRIRRQLPFSLITRDQVNRYLKEEIRHSVKPSEIHAEETALKMFGFAPPDFDLRKTTIDLLTEQAAAFYDFHRKKLFISDWAAANMREAALIHELAHALADQNFPIQKFMDTVENDSEASAARQAVVEGQASWLMLEVNARRQGKSLSDPAVAHELLESPGPEDDSGYPVFDKAPLYLRKTLVFPYDDGQLFQQAVFLRDGKAAFAEVFQKPPVSTSQIEHPRRYFEAVVPANPDLPRPIHGTHPLLVGELGELETRILLEQYIGSGAAESMGPKLSGAAYRIDEGKDRRTTLTYVSQWESDDAAAEYFGDYRRILAAKWKTLDVLTETENRVTGKSDNGYFDLVRNGTKVISREGFGQPL